MLDANAMLYMQHFAKLTMQNIHNTHKYKISGNHTILIWFYFFLNVVKLKHFFTDHLVLDAKYYVYTLKSHSWL